jgi:hypothetical protein
MHLHHLEPNMITNTNLQAAFNQTPVDLAAYYNSIKHIGLAPILPVQTREEASAEYMARYFDDQR